MAGAVHSSGGLVQAVQVFSCCVDLMQAPRQICLGQGGLSDRQSVGHWMHWW